MTPEQLSEIRNLKIAYKKCFATEDGLKVLEHLKKCSHFNETHFIGKTIDPLVIIREESRRQLVLGIVKMIEANLDTPEQTTAITEELV